MHRANALITLSGLREEPGMRRNRRAVERFADRAVASRNRYPIDIALRIAGEAEAVGERAAEMTRVAGRAVSECPGR